MRRAALASLKRLIERHIDSPALSVELICARSGWSRATVYRLFELEGGLARYIRQRRLERAFRELMRRRPRRRRIIDLAIDSQYASEATFCRAFHRLFGVPPGEVRARAARSRRDTPQGVPLRDGRASTMPMPRAR
jgi:AraC-like DNA-binding protein